MFPQSSLVKRTLPYALQTVSFHVKPRWVPVAKSKIYRIPKRPQVPDEERVELLRLNNNYKTQMRAIRRFYHEEMIKEKSSLHSASSEMSQKVEADEWERCVALNDKWNAKIALEREERRKEELARMEEYALQRMERQDRKLQMRIDRASEEIKKLKELSTTFITPETLNEAIDRALDNLHDYNYAIDLRGNRYDGRDTPPVYQKSDQKQNTKQ